MWNLLLYDYKIDNADYKVIIYVSILLTTDYIYSIMNLNLIRSAKVCIPKS